MLIYKLFRPTEWSDLLAAGTTRGAPIDIADGYIHFSAGDTVRETAQKHFADADTLILCAVEAEPLGAALKWEVSRGGIAFPHLYRDLGVTDIAWAEQIEMLDGAHIFPKEIHDTV